MQIYSLAQPFKTSCFIFSCTTENRILIIEVMNILLQGIIGSGFALQVIEQRKLKEKTRRRRPAAELIQVFAFDDYIIIYGLTVSLFVSHMWSVLVVSSDWTSNSLNRPGWLPDMLFF